MKAGLSIYFITGIHNDPRIASEKAIYGMGSFVPGYMPASLEYLYFIVQNFSSHKIILDDFYLETPKGDVLKELSLPLHGVRGSVISPGKSFVIGFLRDLLCSKLRNMLDDDLLYFFAVCTTQDGRRFSSAEYELSLDYPVNPFQDTELSLYTAFFERRKSVYEKEYSRIVSHYGSLYNYADMHKRFGMHKVRGRWVLREWMPAAERLWLTTDELDFQYDGRYEYMRVADGSWELTLPLDDLPHGRYIELHVASQSTGKSYVKRVPAFAVWVEQNPQVPEQWCARVWDPPSDYRFKHDNKRIPLKFPRIYEAHIGIAQPYQGRTLDSVGTYAMFAENILPRIKAAGYTAVQLMGVPEHPLYKSFGYQVSSYFAPSSRFGTPDEFKALVDKAHGMGLGVILDITHSHSAPNTEQGIAMYDTSPYFFADKDNQWGTRSFDYSNWYARWFLLSNCRYWMEEYHVDGFRFDAVGNMIYTDHGFGDDFSRVERCFYTSDGTMRTDEAGILYLSLANAMIHEMCADNITVAEEFSGMPGMTSLPIDGGLGFDYRFAMGIPDFWGKFIKEGRSVGQIWHEMTNRRRYEHTISYTASHDQSINGHDAMIWRLIGDDMYEYMSIFKDNWNTSRGIAIYKLMRFVTLATAGHGYMNFMGDEFGHPEWIDASDYGHRQWHLTEQEHTKYSKLALFDHDSLISIVQAYVGEFETSPCLRYINEDERTFAFERGDLLFVFNFHEAKAHETLELWVKPGKYREIFSSDNVKYAGHGNLEIAEPPVEHFSALVHDEALSPHTGRFQKITIYIPPMVALVMVRID